METQSRYFSRLILIAFSVFFGVGLNAALTTEQTKAIERAIKTDLAAQRTVGLTVAVLQDEDVVFDQGFGLSDLENQVPAKAETSYRLASISKSLSAVLALRLVEEGKLDLDKPVQDYCPEFPQKPWTVTTRHLLSHTSGIRHYKGKEINSTTSYKSTADALEIFKDDALLFEPGTDVQYTTYGYTVLGCVIEAAGGAAFGELAGDYVFTPAKMSSTRIDSNVDLIPNRAQGYKRTQTSWRNSNLMDSSYKIPGGGIVSTAGDLVSFANALLHDKLVTSNTRKEMFTPAPATLPKMPYGMGWQFSRLEGEVFHTGAQSRVATLLYLLPERDFAVAILTNTEETKTLYLARKIAEIVTGEPVE